MSTRDSQRSRVYTAENVLNAVDPRDVSTEAKYRARLDAITSSEWMKQRYPHCQIVKVSFVPQRRGAAAWAGGIVSGTSAFAMHERIMLHELAHVIVIRHLPRAGVQSHGWQFCKVLIELVSRFMSVDAASLLKASFRKHKVRFRAPVKRELTPEQRAALAARLSVYRQPRAKKTLLERMQAASKRGNGWLTVTLQYGWARLHLMQGKLGLERLSGNPQRPYADGWNEYDTEADLVAALQSLGAKL